MSLRKTSAILLALTLVAAAPVFAEEDYKPKKAAPFTLNDAAGTAHSLSDYSGKWVVLEWVNFDCPFVKKQYRPGAMPKRQEHFVDEEVVWLSIASSAEGKQGHFTGDTLTKRMTKEKFAGTAYLIDANGKVGKKYGAKTTPHMFLIDPNGMVVYQGAIDSHRSADSSDIFVATNFVVEAINAAKAGDPIPHPNTRPYGCSVKYAKK
jgi:glutathione peroxidase-family protein